MAVSYSSSRFQYPLVNVKGLSDEEVLDACREFIENSRGNHGACKKVYDSWIRSVIKSARERGSAASAWRSSRRKP